MAISSGQLNCVRRVSFAVFGLVILMLVVSSANAQTQASCQFVRFNTRFFVNNGHRVLEPSGVSDNGTVVGAAYDDVDFSVRGFTRSPNGSITYYKRNTPETYFMDRSDSDITVGITGPAFSPGTTAGTSFFLKGSTFTPFTMTIGGTTYKKFTVWSINRWGTTVGAFTDSSGKKHGFKRFSDGKAIRLDFPGSAQTEAMGINDNGTIVGYLSKTASPNLWRHGFIYSKNGQWAKLDYPSSTLQTELTGISDSNLIIGTTIKGSNATGSFL